MANLTAFSLLVVLLDVNLSELPIFLFESRQNPVNPSLNLIVFPLIELTVMYATLLSASLVVFKVSLVLLSAETRLKQPTETIKTINKRVIFLIILMAPSS